MPAPVGGWNARDSLASMNPLDAPILTNYWPTPSEVTTRLGYSNWATGFPGPVMTVADYTPTSGGSKLFAASGTGIYDATAGGAIGAAVVSGLTSVYFQQIQFSTPGGNFLYMVNGADSPKLYNGTAWASITDGTGAAITSITRVGTLATLTTTTPHGLVTGNTIIVSGATPAQYNGTYVITVTGANTFTYVMASDPGSSAAPVGSYTNSPAITGVTTANLIHINAFKQRLFFVEKNSMNAWYLPVQSVGGAASKLDFTSVFKKGGYLMAMGTWSLDGGYGMDDYAVWVTSRGEMAVYKGTDPSSASTWALVGVYEMGAPLGRKCFQKMGSDLLYIGKDGVSPLSKCLQSTRIDKKSNLTDKIQFAISNASSLYDSNTGWELCVYPLDNMLVLNVPVSSAAQEQYCMNTITGSWTRFTGWAANTFELWNDRLYFGGNTVVSKAWDTYADNGTLINAEAVQAFAYFGNHQNKHFRAARPVLTVNGPLGVRIGINTDFDVTSYLSQPTFATSDAAIWDTSLWDVGVWGSDGEVRKDWQYVGGMGIAASMHIKSSSMGAFMRWAGTDILWAPAGVI